MAPDWLAQKPIPAVFRDDRAFMIDPGMVVRATFVRRENPEVRHSSFLFCARVHHERPVIVILAPDAAIIATGSRSCSKHHQPRYVKYATGERVTRVIKTMHGAYKKIKALYVRRSSSSCCSECAEGFWCLEEQLKKQTKTIRDLSRKKALFPRGKLHAIIVMSATGNGSVDFPSHQKIIVDTLGERMEDIRVVHVNCTGLYNDKDQRTVVLDGTGAQPKLFVEGKSIDVWGAESTSKG
ncbi:hypothetical protein FQN50_001841 [Emmonsiellopsis sp. PD_5]|nr:hypothetical protein FQN50_001841 [Emmonsiellopsis sp. PD_5]